MKVLDEKDYNDFHPTVLQPLKIKVDVDLSQLNLSQMLQIQHHYILNPRFQK